MSLTKSDIKQISDLLDKRFSEQDRKWGIRLDKRFSEQTAALLEVFVTKDYLKEELDKFRAEFRTEFRTRITAVQDAVEGFRKDWKMSAPPLVEAKLNKLDDRVSALESVR